MDNNESSLDYINLYTNAVLNVIFNVFFFFNEEGAHTGQSAQGPEIIIQPLLEPLVLPQGTLA